MLSLIIEYIIPSIVLVLNVSLLVTYVDNKREYIPLLINTLLYSSIVFPPTITKSVSLILENIAVQVHGASGPPRTVLLVVLRWATQGLLDDWLLQRTGVCEQTSLLLKSLFYYATPAIASCTEHESDYEPCY